MEPQEQAQLFVSLQQQLWKGSCKAQQPHQWRCPESVEGEKTCFPPRPLGNHTLHIHANRAQCWDFAHQPLGFLRFRFCAAFDFGKLFLLYTQSPAGSTPLRWLRKKRWGECNRASQAKNVRSESPCSERVRYWQQRVWEDCNSSCDRTLRRSLRSDGKGAGCLWPWNRQRHSQIGTKYGLNTFKFWLDWLYSPNRWYMILVAPCRCWHRQGFDVSNQLPLAYRVERILSMWCS